MKRYICLTAALIASFLCGLAGGEEDGFHHEADTYIGYGPESCWTGWEYSYEHKFFEKLPVTFSVGNDVMFVNKKGPVSLPARLVVLAADIETVLPVFGLKGVYVGAGISPSFYSDGWSFEASSFRLPSRGFAVYQPDDKWTFIGGAAAFPGLKYPVWPVFGAIYRPVKELTFNLVSSDPSIVYSLNDRVSLFAEGNFTYDEYEVDRGAAKNVILRYEDTYAGGGVELRLGKFTKAALTAGGIFDRSLKYRDGGGETDLRSGFYTELRMASEF